MSGFDDLRKHHASTVVTSTERFGEQVTLTFPNGASRPINATCVSSTVVRENKEERTMTSVDRLSVRCERDEKLGIFDPIPGYTLVRSAAKDPSRRPYRFDGEIEKEGGAVWILIFERPTIRREGQ